MKIKYPALQQERLWRRPLKSKVNNKENMLCSDRKPSRSKRGKSKNQNLKEDTIQTIDSYASQRKAPFYRQEINIQLPKFLKKYTAFNKEIAPYEDDILIYIVSTYDQKYLNNSYIKRIRKLSTSRVFYIERMYTVYKKFGLKRTTLYLAVYYFDKYLSKFAKNYNTIGLVAADASIFIAMKYEEIYPPSLAQWQKKESHKNIYQMQAHILQTLDFNLAITTSQHYLEVYHGKNISVPIEEKRLHELVLDLYLFSGYIYGVHPLKITQQVLESFRATSILQRGSNYQQSDANVKHLIANNMHVWNYLIQTDATYRDR